MIVWFLSYFGWTDAGFGMLGEEQMDSSILARIGRIIAWMFVPLGWGSWQTAVASLTGLVAKENIVGTMGVLYGGEAARTNIAASFTGTAGMSFLIFNLLCAPCVAAIAAIRSEMASAKWTWAAIGWQCGLAYAVSFVVYQLGSLCAGSGSITGVIFVVGVIACFVWLLVRKPPVSSVR